MPKTESVSKLVHHGAAKIDDLAARVGRHVPATWAPFPIGPLRVVLGKPVLARFVMDLTKEDRVVAVVSLQEAAPARYIQRQPSHSRRTVAWGDFIKDEVLVTAAHRAVIMRATLRVARRDLGIPP